LGCYPAVYDTRILRIVYPILLLATAILLAVFFFFVVDTRMSSDSDCTSSISRPPMISTITATIYSVALGAHTTIDWGRIRTCCCPLSQLSILRRRRLDFAFLVLFTVTPPLHFDLTMADPPFFFGSWTIGLGTTASSCTTVLTL